MGVKQPIAGDDEYIAHMSENVESTPSACFKESHVCSVQLIF